MRLEFKSNITDGKYILVPGDIVDKIGAHEEVEVVLKLGRDSGGPQKQQMRVQAAFDEYKATYPEDEVGLNDFKYVGIVSGEGDGNGKDDVINAIEAKYDGI